MTGDDYEVPLEVSEVELDDCPAAFGAWRCTMAGAHRFHMTFDDPTVFVEGPDAEPNEEHSTREESERRVDHFDQLRLFLTGPSPVGAIADACYANAGNRQPGGVTADHEPSIDPPWGSTGDGAWGRPLLKVIAETAPAPTWLEAAVAAGYVPTLAGVMGAVHALARLFEAEVHIQARLDPIDAAGHAIAASNAIRDVTGLFDELVAWLENGAAQAMSVANRGAPSDNQPFLPGETVAAVRRGRRAMQRSIHSNHDTKRAEEYEWRAIHD